ncbi:ArsR/SmtB family transcription factor [Nocardiopsis trehalosi]|jgi:DNA-binding transcriptional ArsR family regulator|uniref:ArsR/SmtB family transcription factor n=1 Tax=Nocardiopsis trehalosi TaxID=109329 RepID=UPI000832E3AE|nr:winged helix-turn-helix domain-containing protein [Nocardiopsis trehalosi]
MDTIVEAASVADFAALLADRTRAAMCLALLDGRAWTAGELARSAGVAPSTASEHLARLVDAGVLTRERQGRHAYVRLADPDTARLLEDLAALAGVPARPARSLRAVRAHRDLAAARTCYDHLAGRLGTDIFAALVRRGLLSDDGGLVLTAEGRAWFADLGCAPPADGGGRRPVVRSCLDWTERRPHLAGAAGAALNRGLRERAWITPGARPRSVTVTPEGRRALADLLGIDTAAPLPA